MANDDPFNQNAATRVQGNLSGYLYNHFSNPAHVPIERGTLEIEEWSIGARFGRNLSGDTRNVFDGPFVGLSVMAKSIRRLPSRACDNPSEAQAPRMF